MTQAVFFNIIYILCNAFKMFARYKFMYIFFSECKINKKYEIMFYILCFLVNSSLFIFLSNEIINLSSSIILIFLLTTLYNSSFLKKLVAAVIIMAFGLFIESIVYYAVGYFFLKEDSAVMITLFISTIIYYLAVFLFYKFRNLKSNNKLSRMYVIIISLTSAFSIYVSVVLMLMHDSVANNSINIILCIAALLAINIFVIYIYDVLNKEYEIRFEKKLLEQQNNFYLKQLDVMNQSHDNINFLKHDINEHFRTIKTMLENFDNNEECKEHINKFLKSIDNSGEYAESGNIIIDSILNYKLQEAANKGAEIELELQVPRELNIFPFDMGIILGNLLDNAIEATSKRSGERKIKISICYDKNIIYIDIENTFDSDLTITKYRYETTKGDKLNHGFGLRSVSKTLEKYSGELNISSNGDIFTVNVILYDE